MAYPWSKYPAHVTMRFDLGISRIQLLTEYWKVRRKVPMDLPSLDLKSRNRMAGVYQDAGDW
jgi:hypothetical protein